jgi:predicted HicB family RNase H-like nuclease
MSRTTELPTPLRNVRIPDDEWRAAKAAAEARGESLTNVIRAALRRYVARSK